MTRDPQAYVCRACGGLSDAAGAYLRDGEWRCAGCGETWPKRGGTPDPQADLAHCFLAHYERAGERTPQGRVPTMEEVAHQRGIILRAVEAAGCAREFYCLRDGGLHAALEAAQEQK